MDQSTRVLDSSPPPLASSGLPEPLDAFTRYKPATKTAQSDLVHTHSTAVVHLVGTAAANASREDLIIEEGCVIRGDMATFNMDAFTIIGRGAILRPPLHTYINHNMAQCAAAVRIGAFTIIGANTVSEAAEIGDFVRIDEDCVVGRGVVVPNGVWLQAQTVVLPEAKLAPFTVYGGCPATVCGHLDVDAFQMVQLECVRHAFEAAAGR